MFIISKKLFILLGNGFTIDLINHLSLQETIDVRNLFNHGDEVLWPENNTPGFLSFQHCPNLWNLGARPNGLSNENASKLIQKIISCINVYTYSLKDNKRSNIEKNIYLNAYTELTVYLKYLFIHYDKKVFMKPDIETKISSWGWYKFFSNLKNKLDDYEEIIIVTYNYDLFLEKTLNMLKLDYEICGIDNKDNSKIHIIKPHGSISFQSERTLDNSNFSIHYSRDIVGTKLEDIKNNVDKLNVNSIINAMIPPAGDSSRFAENWSNELQTKAKRYAKTLMENDDVLLCGLSYWHVDRLEIDDILLRLDPKVNFKVISPSISSDLNAVLSTLFERFTLYTKSSIIGGLL